MTSSHSRLLLPLIYMTGLFLLSSIPGDIPDAGVGAAFHWVSPAWQNLLHIPLYAGLTVSWLWALRPHSNDYQARLIAAFVLTVTWGALDEIHQSTVPGRYPSWTDLVLNTLGAALVLAFSMRKPRQTG